MKDVLSHALRRQLPRRVEEVNKRADPDGGGQYDLRRGPDHAVTEPFDAASAEVVYGVYERARPQRPAEQVHERAHAAYQRRIRHLQKRRADARAGDDVEQVRAPEECGCGKRRYEQSSVS